MSAVAGAPRRRVRGFTLMELVVTLALLGVLAAMAAPLAELTVRRHREQALRQALLDIRAGLDRYKVATERGLIAQRVGDSGYPPSLAVLVDGVPNQRSAKGELLYFLRRLPRDPFAPPQLPAVQSWGLRSYQSPAQAPMAGNDVFDVYSRANGKALDGSNYAEW